MPSLTELIREYCEVLDQEKYLERRKESLKAMIHQEMDEQRLSVSNTPFGSARWMSRFKLTPKREAVLGLLEPGDLYPFATFTPPKVTEFLVPKYSRERLIPLFDIQKTQFLQIKRSAGSLE